QERVNMLDQRMLPHKEIYRVCRNYQPVAPAIRDMVIRGAPAIGVAAAMGLALGASKTREKRFDREFERICLTLSKTRPTAVNLFWALERMRRVYTENRSRGVETVKRLLKEEAQKIYKEDIVANKQLGKFGASLLRNARQVMTHCNAGALATAGYGTAMWPIKSAPTESQCSRKGTESRFMSRVRLPLSILIARRERTSPSNKGTPKRCRISSVGRSRPKAQRY